METHGQSSFQNRRWPLALSAPAQVQLNERAPFRVVEMGAGSARGWDGWVFAYLHTSNLCRNLKYTQS